MLLLDLTRINRDIRSIFFVSANTKLEIQMSKMYFLVLLLMTVFNPKGYAEISAVYPIRNHKTDYTKQFEYKLGDDHLIYLRSLNEKNLKTFIGGDLEACPGALSWHLYDCLGYPYKNSFINERCSLLAEEEFISEIAVASELLVAVSNANKVFMYKPTVLERPISWSDQLGSPFSNELYLPANRRSWSFSCSVRNKVIRRVDFMDPSERVIYYSDMNGVKFDFGFTATIYVLLEDGQRIVYWDTGLPPSFSRGFLTPLNGTTQGQSLSAAGSTIFISVLDSSNRLRFFTRMYDYEINGACPGLTYTYQIKIDQDSIYGTVPLGLGERKLPLEGWREHSISKIPEGHLSSEVSIHLTGQGNSARELQIQGTDFANRSGYYFKMIDEFDWQFKPDERLEISTQFPFPYNQDAPQMVKNYYGQVIKAKIPEFQVELNSFHPFLTAEEPCLLSVNYKGETANISLHSVDEWTLVYHTKYHEDLIGVQEGEPKSLQATIVLTPEQLNCSKESLIYRVIQENFLPYHEQVNSIQLVADNEAVFLSSNDGELKLYFSRPLTQSELDESFYIKRARAVVNLVLPQSKEELLKLIHLNKETLNDLIEIHDQYFKDAAWFLWEDICAYLAHPMATVIFNFEKDDPTYKKAVEDLKNPFKSQLRTEWSNLNKENKTFQTAKDILEARILELEELSAHYQN